MDSLYSKLDYTFARVDPKMASSGFLYDRGLHLISPEYFNQGAPVESTAGAFSQLYNSFQSCQRGETNLPELNTLLSNFSNLPRHTVPVAFLNLQYDFIRPNALDMGAVRIENNQIIPVGNYSNILDKNSVQVVSATRLTAEGPNVTFTFPEELWIKNEHSLPVSLDIDLGNGWQRITTNQAVNAHFGNPGVQKIRYQITLSGGQIKSGYFELSVNNPASTTALVEWVIPPAFGEHAGGKARVEFAPTNTSGHLKKPIIILEGVDYYQIAPDVIGSGNWSYLDSRRLFQKIMFESDIWSTYDFVYLDYGNGADFIENNAKVFQALIGIVNADKVLAGSIEKNVVFGYSMGGLVANYGLSEMVKSGQDPQTRQLFTHDTPHQGANVPLGLQYTFRKIYETVGWTGIFSSIASAKEILNAPASQQMLIYQATSSNSYQNNTWLNSVYKPMVSFPSSPAPFEILVTSLGSECGITSFKPGQKLLSIDMNLNLYRTLDIPDILLIQSSSWDFNLAAYGLPTSGSQLISQVKLSHTRNLLWGAIKIKVNLVNFKANSPAGILPIDHVPGGYYPMHYMMAQSLPGFKWNIIHVNFFVGKGFTYIPTRSALDMPETGFASFTKGYNSWSQGIPGSKINRFRAAEPLSSAYNHSHVFVTFRHAEFIDRKIHGLPPTGLCPIGCSISYTSTSPGAVCPGSEGAFEIIPESSEGLSYQWNGSAGATITFGGNSSSATVKVNENNTTETLSTTCTYSKNGCNAQKSFTFNGLSDIDDIEIKCGSQVNWTAPGDMFCQSSVLPSYFYLTSPQINGNQVIAWEVFPASNGSTPITETVMTNGQDRNLKVKANGASELNLKVKITSDCGSREKTFAIPFTFPYSGTACLHCDQSNFLRVEPNPVIKGTVSQIRLDIPSKFSLPAQAEILDARGLVVLRTTVETNPAYIPVTKLEPAEYQIRILSGDEIEKSTLYVKASSSSKMLISPNPVFKDIDSKVLVEINNPESENEVFEIQLNDASGTTVLSFSSIGNKFSLDVTDLEIGNYTLTAVGQTVTFQEDLTLTMKGKPYLTISPNPVTGDLSAIVINPLKANAEYFFTITDKFGNVLLKFSETDNKTTKNIGNLTPDLYYLSVHDGNQEYRKLFRKE